MNSQAQGIIGVCVAQTVLGTIGACVLESGADSISAAFYRCVFGGLALALYCQWRGELSGLRRIPWRSLALAMASGLLMVGNWVLFFEGIQRAGIAVATILFHIQPFFVVILGAVCFRERLQVSTFLWFGLAIIGLGLATGIDAESLGLDHSYLIGIACTLGAAMLYAFVTVIAKGLRQVKPSQLTLMQCLCGTVMLAGIAPLASDAVSPAQWGWLALIGIVHTGGMYAVLYGALPKLTTPVIAALLFVYPASAIVVDALVYGHILDVSQFAGLAFILLASLGVTLRWGMRAKPAAQPA